MVLVEVLSVESFAMLSFPTSCREDDEGALDAGSRRHVGASGCQILHQRRSVLCLLLL
jgi:hypothetical protein